MRRFQRRAQPWQSSTSAAMTSSIQVEFQKYAPVVMSLLPKYGGVVLASDTAASLVEGTARTMNAIIRFPSKDAALGLYNDPAYQEAKRVRQASTKNTSMVLVEEFDAKRAVRVNGQPRRAASMVAMSIFFIGIIASKARFASARRRPARLSARAA